MPAAPGQQGVLIAPVHRGPSVPAPHGERACTRDAQFFELLDAYRRSGGLARAGEVGAALGRQGAADIATLARWIVRGEVIHVEWQADTWMPLFQFGGPTLQPHATVGRVIAELAAVMPPLALVQWFGRSNCALAGQRPADALAADPEGVWQAARTDRFLIDG
jgi:hypothetical protein